MSWENLEDAFKELDRQEYLHFAKGLRNYHRALLEEGFSREEAFDLAKDYGNFIYRMTIEEFTAENRRKELMFYIEEVPEDGDVDSDEEE